MTNKLAEETKLVVSVVPQDIGTADITSTTYVSIQGYRRFRAFLTCVSLAATQTATMQLKQATSAAGAGAKNLGSLATFTSPAGGAVPTLEIEASSGELDKDNGFYFVGMTIGTSVNGSLGAGNIQLGEPDYLPVK